ncbi:MAG TPA: hypothetical protein VHO27_16480, partial [Angustibacter sp.]|nr:hypothetical protein [Angustibacter sp.]
MPADLRPVGGPTAWRRRSVLAAAAAVPAAGLAACSLSASPSTSSPASSTGLNSTCTCPRTTSSHAMSRRAVVPFFGPST